VLKVGVGSRSGEAEDRAGLVTIVGASLASAFFAALVGAKVFAGEIAAYFRFGPSATGAATGLAGSLSLALLGAGHLMGIAVGMAMLVGVFTAWGVAVPWLTAMHGEAGPAADIAQAVARNEVRFIGAGAIGAAAVWTLGKLVAPIMAGLASAAATARKVRAGEGEDLPRTERDIPMKWVLVVSALCLAPLAVLSFAFLSGTPLETHAGPLIVAGLAYVVLAGFLVAAVCGYMAGLIGSSNSPVSGVAILAVLGAAVLLAMLARAQNWIGTDDALVAFALFVTSVLLAVAVIANDNLQDLKTGQLVDATPWRQQVALIVGVVAGAVVIPPILYLLNKGYGFAGMTGAAETALPAPQANLISTLAKGVVGGSLDWGLIGVGVIVGAVLVAIDETLRRTSRFSLPPLAAGLAIYLPTAVTVPVILGAVLGYVYDRWAARQAGPESARRLGVLMASGLIVGESLFSVALAGVIVGTGNDAPLALVGEGFEGVATILGALAYAAAAIGLYAWIRRQGRSVA
jgi:putative OPT family oligopeptide transporter